MVAAAVIGSAVVGGVTASSAAKKAAKTTTAAADQANALQKEIYDKNTANLRPAMDTGNLARGNLSALLGLGGDEAASNKAFDQYLKSTGYQFTINQGQDAIATSRAARGSLNSGATLKSLSDYGQNTAQKFFGNYAGNLGALASQGQAAAGALAGVGTQYAGQVGANSMGAADTAANAKLAGANAWSGALQQGAGALGNFLGGQSSYNTNTPPISPNVPYDPFRTAGVY